MTVHYLSTLLEPLNEQISSLTFKPSAPGTLSEYDIENLKNIRNGAENSTAAYLAGLSGIGDLLSHNGGAEFGQEVIFNIGWLLTEMSRTLIALDCVQRDSNYALYESPDRDHAVKE